MLVFSEGLERVDGLLEEDANQDGCSDLKAEVPMSMALTWIEIEVILPPKLHHFLINYLLTASLTITH